MKKRTVFGIFIFCLAVVLTTAACASGSRTQQAPAQTSANQQTNDPLGDFIRNARRTAPEGAILGIGSSTHSQRGLRPQTAESRARAEVLRQIDVVVKNMINDYIAGSEEDPQAAVQFSESVTQNLAAQRLQGVIIFDEFRTDGETVYVALISRANIASEIISASQAVARLNPSAAAAMQAIDRMDRALTANNMLPPVIRDYD